MSKVAYGPNERADEPIEHVEAGEEVITCGHCGARTAILSEYSDGSRHERCSDCGQSYIVKYVVKYSPEEGAVDEGNLGEIEVVDENTGEVVGMTALPGFESSEMALKEIANGDRPAEQADLDHLFGKKSPYPDFGSF